MGKYTKSWQPEETVERDQTTIAGDSALYIGLQVSNQRGRAKISREPLVS
jgi:hypothetical protein